MSERGLAGQLLHSGVFFGLGFAARIVLAVALGKSLTPGDYGVYGLIAAVVAMATGLLPLGAPQYVAREVPGAPMRKAATLFKSVTGVEVLLLGVVVLVAVPLLAGVPAIAELFALGEHPGLVALVAVVLVGHGLTAEVSRFLFARKRIEQGNVVLFLQTGLWGFLAALVFVLGALTLPRLLALWALSLALALVYGLSRLDLRALKAAPFEPGEYVAAVRFGFPLLAAHVLAGADWFSRFLLAGYHSTDVMGVYAYHQNVILMIAAISSPLVATPLDPHVVAAYSTGQVERSGQLLGLTLRFRLVLVIPLLVVIVVWGDAVVRLLARGDYVASPWLFVALAPVPLLLTLSNTFERAMFLERRTGVISRCQLVAAVTQVILCLLLVPADPVHGPALALSGGYLMLTALLWFHYRRSTVRIELALFRTALATLPCLAVAWATSLVLPRPPGLAALAAATAVAGGSYLIFASFFRVLSDSERRWLRAAVCSGGRAGRLLWRRSVLPRNVHTPGRD